MCSLPARSPSRFPINCDSVSDWRESGVPAASMSMTLPGAGSATTTTSDTRFIAKCGVVGEKWRVLLAARVIIMWPACAMHFEEHSLH